MIAHALGHFLLDLEGQPVICPADEEVQIAAHGPQEILGALEGTVFGFREYALADQFGVGLDAVEIFADPVERIEIAQHQGNFQSASRTAQPETARHELVRCKLASAIDVE